MSDCSTQAMKPKVRPVDLDDASREEYQPAERLEPGEPQFGPLRYGDETVVHTEEDEDEREPQST